MTLATCRGEEKEKEFDEERAPGGTAKSASVAVGSDVNPQNKFTYLTG